MTSAKLKTVIGFRKLPELAEMLQLAPPGFGITFHELAVLIRFILIQNLMIAIDDVQWHLDT